MNRDVVGRAMPSPTMREQLITKNQKAEDIARLLLYAEKQSRPHVGKILPFFAVKKPKDVCYRLWFFLRRNINYHKEPPTRQTAKTINRIVKDGYGDCKHYATFAVCVLHALGIPCTFRLASFEHGNTNPTHAYCVAYINGEEVYIDPCIKQFDQECAYKHKHDLKPSR